MTGAPLRSSLKELTKRSQASSVNWINSTSEQLPVCSIFRVRSCKPTSSSSGYLSLQNLNTSAGVQKQTDTTCPFTQSETGGFVHKYSISLGIFHSSWCLCSETCCLLSSLKNHLDDNDCRQSKISNVMFEIFPNGACWHLQRGSSPGLLNYLMMNREAVKQQHRIIRQKELCNFNTCNTEQYRVSFL